MRHEPLYRGLEMSSKPTLIICALALFVFVQGPSSQASATPQVSAPVTDTPCLFDFERGEIPNCVRQTATGQLFISPEALRQLHFNSYGLAPVFSPKEGWMYVSRRGIVVIKGVPTMDNGPDTFHDGLVRVIKNGKYGFANSKGQLVVPASYDGALNFEHGKAKVCKGCISKCADTGCEHRTFAGGEWFLVDTRGTPIPTGPDN